MYHLLDFSKKKVILDGHVLDKNSLGWLIYRFDTTQKSCISVALPSYFFLKHLLYRVAIKNGLCDVFSEKYDIVL